MNTTNEQSPASSLRRGRILVADDEERSRRLLHHILEAKGYEVIFAENGQQALEKAFAEQPDVILLDVMMPIVDGYEACRRLKADPRSAPIPVIMVTALSDRQDRIKGVDAGADDFLLKPIDREELLLRIRNAAYRKRLYDELQDKYQELRAMAELRESLTHMINADTEALSSLLRQPPRSERAAKGQSDGTGGVTQEGGDHGAP